MQDGVSHARPGQAKDTKAISEQRPNEVGEYRMFWTIGNTKAELGDRVCGVIQETARRPVSLEGTD